MKTVGEYLVGTSFNPSADNNVDIIKSMGAQLIDAIMSIPMPSHGPENAMPIWIGETGELKMSAMRFVEIGVMLAVKAATKPMPPRSICEPDAETDNVVE